MHAVFPVPRFARAPADIGAVSRAGRELTPVLVAFGLVLLIWVGLAGTAASPTAGAVARDAYYNRLVDGLLSGHLYLDKPVPAEVLKLANPYDPAELGAARGVTFTPGSLHDLSYFRGRLYLYFSVIPAVLLFLPYHLATGAYLSQQYACVLLLAAGLAFVCRVLVGMWRESFARVPPLIIGALVLAAGLVPFTPVLMQRPDVYEVPIAAAYFFTSATIYGVWRIARQPPTAVWPIALLSLGVACAVGCRPSEIASAGLLVFAFLFYWRSGYGAPGRRLRLLVATAGPIATVAAALLAYNYLRFGDPAEFGARYQLNLDPATPARFNAANLAYNAWLYLLHFPGWSTQYPFAGPWRSDWPLPATMAGVEHPLGLLTAAPFTCLGFVALLHWQKWTLAVRRVALTCLWVAVTNALVLCLFVWNASRYELAFAPSLVLVAAFGVMSLETWAASAQRFTRTVVRFVWMLLLTVSVGYGVLFAVRLRGESWGEQAASHFVTGNRIATIECCEHALRFDPESILALKMKAECEARLNRRDEALRDFRAVVARNPDDVIAWNYLGALVMVDSRGGDEAVACFRRALSVAPNHPATHFNLARALLLSRDGRSEAIAHLRAALRLNPSFVEARQLLAETR